MQTNPRKWIILASPIFVVFIGHFAARLFSALLGQWAWVGVFFTYWGSLFIIMAFLGGKDRLKAWFGKSQGSRWWIFLAVIMGALITNRAPAKASKLPQLRLVMSRAIT